MFEKYIQIPRFSVYRFGLVVGDYTIEIKSDSKLLVVIIVRDRLTRQNVTCWESFFYCSFDLLLVCTQIQHCSNGFHVWVWNLSRQEERT